MTGAISRFARAAATSACPPRARRVPVTGVNNGFPGFRAVNANKPLTCANADFKLRGRTAQAFLAVGGKRFESFRLHLRGGA
jgi:hypothetical protein